MEVSLEMEQWDEADRYAQALEDYTRAETLPRCDFFISRGRALAAHGRGKQDHETEAELRRLLDQAGRAGLIIALSALEAALAAN
jgi:hypothetical protein